MNEYCVVEDWRCANFEEKVNAKLKEGWSIAGGIAIASNDGGNIKCYVQAMVRKVKNA